MDCTDTCHLTACLDCHDKDGTSEVGPSAEEIEVPDTLARSFSDYLGLDQLEFGEDVRVVQVVVCMQQRKNSKAVIRLVMRTEPSIERLATLPPWRTERVKPMRLWKRHDQATQEDGWNNLTS